MCDQAGPICVQAPPGQAEPTLGVKGHRQSEDCLTLNIWTPGTDGYKRPTMVWLHGGAFLNGCGASPWTDGSVLARMYDVVVVTLNYRLGIIGFLDLGSMFGDEFESSANCGFLDQAAGLRWVRDNITAFGGDPDCVTLFGESAGAVSVGLHVAASSDGWRPRRVVMQSGGLHTTHSPDDAAEISDKVIKLADLRGAQLKELQAASAGRLIDAQQALLAEWFSRLGGGPLRHEAVMPFKPVRDGTVVPQALLPAYRSASSNVDLLIGTNDNEFNLVGPDLYPDGCDEPYLNRMAAEFFGADAGAALAAYRGHHPTASTTELAFALEGDQIVGAPTDAVVRHHSGTRYRYRFSLAGTGMERRRGTAHAFEIPFVFGSLDATGVDELIGEPTLTGRRLAAAIGQAWTSFARSGEPHVEGARWTPFDTDGQVVMVLDHAPHVEAYAFDDVMAFWKGIPGATE